MNYKYSIIFVCLLSILISCEAGNNDNERIENNGVNLRCREIPLSLAYSSSQINAAIYRVNSITSDKKFQVASYYDGNGKVVLAKRPLDSDTFEIVTTEYTGVVTDNHNIIAVAIDGDGFIHLTYDHHNGRLKYRVSKNPYELQFGELQYMVDSMEEQRITYPEFHRKQDGNLIFVYRNGRSGNGDMIMNEYSVKEKKWERKTSKLIDGENSRNAYWQMYMDKNDHIYLSWTWRETTDVNSNHDICYAQTIDGINWTDSNGKPYELPITMRAAEVIQEIPQNSDLMNQTSMTVDNNNIPYVTSYWRDFDKSVPQYRILSKSGSSWSQIYESQRTSPFTLTEGQSLGNRFPISRPKILIDDFGHCFLFYCDEERNSMVSLTYCEDWGKTHWKTIDLTNYSVEAWEPTYDRERWKREKVIDLFVQKVYQGKNLSSEPEMARVLEIRTR